MIQRILIYILFTKNGSSNFRSDFMNQFIRYLFVCICVILILFESIIAQDESIRNLELFITDNELNSICHFKSGFIDEDTRQTLSSGLTSTFNFQINLMYENGNIIRNQMVEVAIRYDIWEKQYLLFYNNQIHQFSEYQTFESFLYDSLTFHLGSVKGISYKKPLQVIVFFSPEKISSAQKEKLNFWLTSSAETKESAPGMEQESGFSIDLSKLFSVFLSDKPKTNLQQYQSKIFTIEKLRKNEKSSQ